MKIRGKLHQSEPASSGSPRAVGASCHKVATKAKDKRGIYLSWVPDAEGFVRKCVLAFRKKLAYRNSDEFDRGLEILESPHEAAGAIKGPQSEAMRSQQLDDATDFVAILCDEYLSDCARGLGDAGFELSRILYTKYAWEQQSKDPSATGTHCIWAAPAVKVNLRLKVAGFDFREERYRRWWHYFKAERERFRTGKDEEDALEDDVFAAVETLLGHDPFSCSADGRATSMDRTS